MDFLDYLTNPYIPIWLGLLAALVKLFQKELAAFVPLAIRGYFLDRAARIKEREAHQAELEEVSIEALAQSNVTAQLQLIQVNRHLVDFLTSEINSGISDIQAMLREVRDLGRDGQAQNKIVQVEWTRVGDTLARAERLLANIEASFQRGGNGPDVQ